MVPQISKKNRYDARIIISTSSFLTKPSYGAFPRGVLVGLIPKSGRESTEKSPNYDTTCVMNRLCLVQVAAICIRLKFIHWVT